MHKPKILAEYLRDQDKNIIRYCHKKISYIDWQLSYVEDLVEQPVQSVVVRQCVSTPHGLLKHPTYESRLGHQDDESQPEGADGWINHAGHMDFWATWDTH